MLIKIVKILLIAVAVEALAIIVLVLLVALFGPSDQVAAQAYAQRLGYWVGPIAGFILCVAGGWLSARKFDTHQVLAGLGLGAAVAAIDVGLLVASGVEFQPVFAVSNIGRLVAGAFGGFLASRAKSGQW